MQAHAVLKTVCSGSGLATASNEATASRPKWLGRQGHRIQGHSCPLHPADVAQTAHIEGLNQLFEVKVLTNMA